MKKLSQKLALIVLLLTFWGCQTDNSKNTIAEPFQAEQERIKNLITEIFNVAKSKNMDSLDTYHLNGPKFSKFDDGDVSGRQDYAMGKKTESEFFTGVSDFSYKLPDTKVDVFDDVAIATFIIDYNVVVNNSPIAGQSRGTLVFIKDSGRWKIAHEHFSPMPTSGQ